MAFAGRTERLIVAGLVVCLAIVGLVAYSLRSDGYTARHVDLNDGGIWAASDHDGLFGRANLPAGSLDAAVPPPGDTQPNYQLSVMQDASGVVARDGSNGKLYPVDVSTGQILQDNGIAISTSVQVAIGGGTLAVLDPDAGKVWALRYDPAVGISNLSPLGSKARPVASLGATTATGRQSALAVGTDGTVRALASAKGANRLAVVRPDGLGFHPVRYSKIVADLPAPQIAAVGDSTVVFDASVPELILPSGKTVTLPDRSQAAKLQMSGPASSRVLVATNANLYSVNLSSGRVTSVSAAGTGTPAAPVVAGDCYYGAWSGTPGAAVRSCGGAAAQVVALQNQKLLQNPQLQVNRNSAVLNDVVGGGIWNLSNGREIDNWQQVKPPQVPKPKPNNKNSNLNQANASAPPRAVNDTFGARPSRTTILHVLDNDSDPAGRILTIAAVTAPDNRAAQLDISPDGQTVQIRMPATGSAVHFSYTVNDNLRLSATASVTVVPHPLPENKPPNLRIMANKVWTVPSGGKLSLPVISDWRDADGDPPVLADATASAGRVSTTPDGRLDYIAPVQAGTQRIRYHVTDNIAETAQFVTIDVLDKRATNTVAPIAEPDVARGQVGKPIIIRPLDNDLPGADPTNPDAQLRIAARIPNPDGVTITTDLQSGIVTVVASQQKDFVFTYTVSYGSAAYARGSVRVNIDGPQAKTPIAVLDTVALHGQRPVTADVLSNDFDPAGGLLVVQHAEPAAGTPATGDLQVAIIQGRYLRINALTPKLTDNPEIINYTVTNGFAQATGQVSVSQLPEPAIDVPVPQDDYAVVRAGDSTSVPVLDNDTDPSGDTLSLVTDVDGAPAPGRLDARETSDASGQVGRAYVSTNVVRYVAPAGIRSETSVTVDYVVTNSAGNQATGHLFLTIEPPPTTSHPDQAPTPPEIDVRVVAGDTVTIPIRTTNSDPDGDAVSLVGIGQGTSLGRILGQTASSLRYQAYPSSKNSGTDTFSYIVTDRYGQTGRNNIRVAVVQPGDPQPPVAADISVTAAPGKVVSVDALAAAFRSPDDRVSLLDLSRNNHVIPGNATLRTKGAGPILVTAPSGPEPVELRYSISDGLSAPSAATVTVREQRGIDLPPVAVDDYAGPASAGTTVTLDPAAKAYDPDSPTTPDVRLTRVYASTATIVGGKVAIEVTARPQIVPYEVTDAGGAVATASVFVPAAGAGAPYAKAGQQIAIDANSTKAITAASYAVDPAGKPLQLTTANAISSSPADGLKVSLDSATGLTLTSINHYTGPASVTFQVTDGTSLNDPDGTEGIITVPVQVGPETPVLRCTTSPLSTVQGGATLDIDVTSLCHVWVADPRTLDSIQYNPSWRAGSQPDSVTLSGAGTKTLHLFAAGTSTPNDTGSFEIRVAGNDAVVPGLLNVAVVAAPRPTVQPVTLSGVRAGSPATVNMADYTTSPLVDKNIGIVSESPVSQSAGITANGSSLTITPGANAKGTIVYDVLMTDTITDRTNSQRQATGRLTVHVLGRPDPPTDVTPDRSLLSEQANLSWNTPANNGLPIDHYLVSWAGGSQICPASPCTIRNLTNGQTYRFTVQAHNSIGNSLPSAQSGPDLPNAVPQAPTNITFSDPSDGKLTVSWQAAKVNGTRVTGYVVSWPGHHQSTSGQQVVATGLDNDAMTDFYVVAQNAAGSGPPAHRSGQSSGTPQYPAPPAAPQQLPKPKLDPTQAGDHQAVVLSWPATNPNGPGPVNYTVTRTDNGQSKVLCSSTRSTTCTDPSVSNDGSTVDYTYVATNGTGNQSQPSAPGELIAVGDPQGIDNVTAQGTGTDGHLSISFATKPVYDKQMTVNCTVQGGGSCGSWTYDGGTTGHTETNKDIVVNQDGQTKITLQQCNTHNTCSATTQSATATAFGRLGNPSVSNAQGSGPLLDFTVTYNTHGAPIRVRVQVQERNHNSLDDFDSAHPVFDNVYTLTDNDAQDHTLTFNEAGSPNGGAAINLGSNQDARISVSLGDADNGFGDARGTGGSTVVAGGGANQPFTGQVTTQVSRGSTAGAPKDDTAYGHVHLKLTGFQAKGTVSCSFSVDKGANPAPVMLSTDDQGNYDQDLDAIYDSGGGRLTASCEGIDDTVTWPS